ncbi:hypothetical protein SprV_0200591400 [Sparganum proliferum]
MNVTISGVAETQSKFLNYSTRGVKAHFSLDYSCVLRLTEVNLLLDLVNDTTEASQGGSALQKIADGISSFFGGAGSKGEATTEDTPDSANATTPEPSSEATSTPAPASSATASDTSTSEPPATTTAPPPPIKRFFVEPLPFKVNLVDTVVPSNADMANSRKLLRELNALDEERRETERLRNSLESSIYESREKSQSKDFTKHTTSAELSVLEKVVSEASEWYHEDGFAASKKELEGWIQKLNTVLAPLDQRIRDFDQLPVALKKLSESLSNADKMLDIMKAFQIAQPAEKPTAGGSAENASSTTVDESEEAKQNASTSTPFPPVLQVFSETEVKVFEGVVNTTKLWLENSTTALKTADPAANPPFTMTDVADRMQRLVTDLHFYSTKFENWRLAAERVRAEAARRAAAAAASESTTEQSTAGPTVTAEGQSASEGAQAEKATEEEPLTTNSTSVPETTPRSDL